MNIVFLTKRKSGKRRSEIRTRGREKKEGRGGERTTQILLRKYPFSHRPRGAVNVLLGEASLKSGKRGREIRTRGREKKEGRGGERTAQKCRTIC